MIKENFICPCCGLPNHLEFKSRANYDRYLNKEHSEEYFEANPNNYQFNRYEMVDDEDEESGGRDGRRIEIEKRFKLIKDYWSKEYQDFKDWFSKEVVGFIPDKELGED